MAKRTVCIAGAAEGPLGKVPDHSELSMMGLAARAALAEAGLTERDVDGLFIRYRTTEPLVEHSVEFGEFMGIRPRFADSTDIGGGSFEAYVHHALLAVEAGRCDVDLIAYTSRRGRWSRAQLHGGGRLRLSGQFEGALRHHVAHRTVRSSRLVTSPVRNDRHADGRVARSRRAAGLSSIRRRSCGIP
jgi:hypothetical protein